MQDGGMIQGRPVAYLSASAIFHYLGPAIAGLLTGSLIVEQIFGLPGIGRYFVDGAISRDYPLVMGVTVLYGAIIILANLLTDIARGILDPKVSYE